MPNVFAYSVLVLWPVVTLLAFASFSRSTALALTIICGYLFLPTSTSFYLPVVPNLNKDTVPSLSALLICLISFYSYKRRDKISYLRQYLDVPYPVSKTPSFKLIAVLITLTFALSILTLITNRDAVVAGPRFIRGFAASDAVGVNLEIATILIPFLLARRFLGSPQHHILLLKIIAVAGLVYSLPMLFEIRMSPQLNRWVYGFFPHSFAQHIRSGGFRPLVFLQHGLWVGIFTAMSILATAGLIKLDRKRALLWTWALVWLLGTLFLAKTLGALLLTFLLLPIALFFGTRLRLFIVATVASIVLFYPAVRQSGLLPLDRMVELSSAINPHRAASLQFRFYNEDLLLERVLERPFFGWGVYGRARIYDANTGADLSVTDGKWIIVLGEWGWLGYLVWFGLLVVPLVLLATRRKKLGIGAESSLLGLVLLINLIDLLPNAALTPVTYLIAGALAGRLGYQPLSAENLPLGKPAAAPRKLHVRKPRTPKLSEPT